jgi:hypothetical protein
MQEIAMIKANFKSVADVMRLYLTHCSKEKDLSLKGTPVAVTPGQLYTNVEIQQFMQRCRRSHVHWAILSDLYGIYFADDQHIWYEKPPDTVTPEEEAGIIESFNQQLNRYDEIYFFIRPASFHPFYARVLQKNILAERVKMFQDLEWIQPSVDDIGLNLPVID